MQLKCCVLYHSSNIHAICSIMSLQRSMRIWRIASTS